MPLTVPQVGLPVPSGCRWATCWTAWPGGRVTCSLGGSSNCLAGEMLRIETPESTSQNKVRRADRQIEKSSASNLGSTRLDLRPDRPVAHGAAARAARRRPGRVADRQGAARWSESCPPASEEPQEQHETPANPHSPINFPKISFMSSEHGTGGHARSSEDTDSQQISLLGEEGNDQS